MERSILLKNECLPSLPGDGRPKLQKLLNLLLRLLCISGTTYIIIDALDECPKSARDNGLERLMDTLNTLNTKADFRMLITSRPEPDIHLLLPKYTTHTLSLHDDAKHREDIRAYVDSKLLDSSEIYPWEARVKEKARYILSERSNGM